jgi:hypothetical protein
VAIGGTQSFHLFGMGPGRRKLLYQAGGLLRDALNGEVIRRWEAHEEKIVSGEYRVELGEARIVEDEEGVWIEERGDRVALTRSPVKLPRFDGHPRAALLRALHAELLVNVMPWGPVPNLWVYPRPWYRDAAMMLLCFQRTGNHTLLEPWVNGLDKPWDRNNAGQPEADNLGQALFMVSLVGDRRHPLVETVLKAVPTYQRDRHIVGLTDYAEHPVYQTKWLKYGLRHLGLDDPYEVPSVFDSYDVLFWMDFRDQHVPGPRFETRSAQLYPYLAWAEAHFHSEPPPMPVNESATPLTWEGKGSEADYWRMAIVSREKASERVCLPHTWHAAELFLYFLDQKP